LFKYDFEDNSIIFLYPISVEQIKGLRSIEVKLVWKPTWSKDLMSEDAKLALDIF